MTYAINCPIKLVKDTNICILECILLFSYINQLLFYNIFLTTTVRKKAFAISKQIRVVASINTIGSNSYPPNQIFIPVIEAAL